MPRARAHLLPWLLLAVAGAGLLAHALLYPFITDDAYISFRYSENLARHGQLVFNLGDRVEGYTNFLWTALLGGLLKLGLRPEVMSRVLGAAFGLAGLLLVYVMARLYRGGRASPWEAVGPLLLAASAGFAVWCSGGLETQMFTALALGGMTLYLAESARRTRSWRFSGTLFALAAMTRPEGLMLFGLTGLHRLCANLVGERRLMPRASELGWLLGFFLPFGIFFVWRYRYYGYPFPNTYYIKAAGASASALRWGVPYLWDFVRDNRLWVLLALLPLFWPRTCWARSTTGGMPANERVPVRPRFFWSYLALIAIPFAAYVVAVGGDFMAMGRFFVPTLPLLALLAAEALRETFERPRRDRSPDAWRLSRLLPATALLVGLAVWNSVGLYRANQQPVYHRWGLDTVAYLDRFAADRILIGRWMREHFPKDTYLAVGGAGAIVYASRLRALDTFGLNDRFIAHHTPPVGDRPGHTKTAPDDYLRRERPDLMCHQAHHQDFPYRPPPSEEQHWRGRGYHWVCLAPPGLHPAYYCCLKRLDKALGPFPPEVGS
jgi:arabinofuranosyltransferase